ncbi:hypothetical protein [Tenacibaculum sp. M341]|uniref:hypothetical protein n=1 Tax=Tenacibaculum sp. M341 TaxID=2530339 RepID=UPI00104F8666|nr:hypothetical protein [Tenacibaculum sp. M341]TCI92317.1 hypothetical protein EYW44_09045 [Tenacibaculum sp. M341]
MKLLFKYLRGLLKPSFKPSEEDLLILRTKKYGKEESFEEKEERENTYHSNLNTLLLIHSEAKQKTRKAYYNSDRINFKKLIEYSFLVRQHSEVKISFLYFLIKVIKVPPASLDHVSEGFKIVLFSSIFTSNLHWKSKYMIDFFQFWNSKEYYSLKMPLHLFVKEINKLVVENKVNDELIRALKKYVAKNTSTSNDKEIEDLLRIITKHQNKKETFLLLPDYFGKKVNSTVLSSENLNVNDLSQIFQFLSLKKTKKNEEEQLQNLINDIGYDSFIEISIKTVELAACFKPKMRINVFWHPYYRKHKWEKIYSGMFNENLIIIYNLLELLAKKELVKKIPMKYLTTIAKRSFDLKKEIRLGKSSTKIGDVCIKILAHNFGKEGVQQLDEIYHEIKYKNVQKKIETLLKEVD